MDTAAAAMATGGGEEDQARMEAITDNLQTRDALRLYNWVSHRCFSDCVTTFYRRALGKTEEDCVHACVRKFLLLSTASASRFAHLAAAAADDD
ncbi:mitochondrial import inner membrane translocase subunit Tim9-like [Oryza brachyantha]|uniref:Mitochondrial import inner membrane translocase subunit n=1 Tax=Oryza brachyantha TaxID=4533 RepID=J3M3B0_ORYBR|nr:mitochondrial import inner membrane translocase subunit Tim9-like [Oryza brachyantha]